MSRCYMCRSCRRKIRDQIEWTFIAQPRWMGLYIIRFHGRLGWVPMRVYRSIVKRMVRLGILIKSLPDPSDPRRFPRYILARCMVPPQALAESVKGGDS